MLPLPTQQIGPLSIGLHGYTRIDRWVISLQFQLIFPSSPDSREFLLALHPQLGVSEDGGYRQICNFHGTYDEHHQKRILRHHIFRPT